MRVRSDRPALVLAMVVAGASLPVPALAQPSGPQPPGPPGGSPATVQAGVRPGSAEAAAPTAAPNALNWVQVQIDRLHRQLRITPAQENAWTQFAETMRVNARHLDELYQDRAERFENMSAVDNLRNYQQIVQAQADDLARKAATFQALYESLSPEQKLAADRIFRYQEERREQRRMAHRAQ